MLPTTDSASRSTTEQIIPDDLIWWFMNRPAVDGERLPIWKVINSIWKDNSAFDKTLLEVWNKGSDKPSLIHGMIAKLGPRQQRKLLIAMMLYRLKA